MQSVGKLQRFIVFDVFAGVNTSQTRTIDLTPIFTFLLRILMHLCDIPAEAMNQLHLPNGLPLVYNVKAKCITLLDDGRGLDPLSVHDFGPAAKYLFKPCELPDEFFDSSNAS